MELAPSCHPVVQGCSVVGNGGYVVETYAGNVSNYGRFFAAGNQPDAFRITSEPINASALWLDHGVPYHYNRGDRFAIPSHSRKDSEVTPSTYSGAHLADNRNSSLTINLTFNDKIT